MRPIPSVVRPSLGNSPPAIVDLLAGNGLLSIQQHESHNALIV